MRRQLLALAEDATLYHQAPGDRNEHGVYVPGATVSRNIKVVAQPPSDAVVARVGAEGTRVAGALTFYVLPSANIAPLRTGDMPTGRDLITHKEINYVVHSLEPWGDYLLANAERLDVQEPIIENPPVAMVSGGDIALSDSDRVVS